MVLLQVDHAIQYGEEAEPKEPHDEQEDGSTFGEGIGSDRQVSGGHSVSFD
jgi:hypothetical protein